MRWWGACRYPLSFLNQDLLQRDIARIFSELQRDYVSQGGIHSVEQYKAHTNDTLKLLEEENNGHHIGTCFGGAPTCGHDTALLSDTVHGPQLLNSILHARGSQSRPVPSDTKTKIQVHNTKISSMLWNEATPWTMACKPININKVLYNSSNWPLDQDETAYRDSAVLYSVRGSTDQMV